MCILFPVRYTEEVPRLHILPENVAVDCTEGETVLAASLRAGTPHAHLCGGGARCSTCRVAVVEGATRCRDRTTAEFAIAESLRFPPTVRLACQLRIDGDVTVRRLVLDADDLDLANLLGPRAGRSTLGEERSVAVMFTDLRDFTSLSEALPPFDVMHVLERHLLAMRRAAERFGGVVNNLMGDGMLILFEGEDAHDRAERAVRAALAMLDAQEELSRHVEALFGRPLRMGIGIHDGTVVLGVLCCGDEHRKTILGDTVNLASRIEQANKELGTSLLVSDTVASALGPGVVLGRDAELPLKGKTGTHRLHEIRALSLG